MAKLKFFCLCPSDEGACLPPQIPNADYIPKKSWYSQEEKITDVKCHDGYEEADRGGQGICRGGAWHSVPVCESKYVMFYKNKRKKSW